MDTRWEVSEVSGSENRSTLVPSRSGSRGAWFEFEKGLALGYTHQKRDTNAHGLQYQWA